MAESFQSRIKRWGFNFFPVYRRTGARITYISGDWREVHIKLPLNWKTKNYVGTIFGGSMYAAVDPLYMVMFIKLLGPEYIVWDKAASIKFKQPGRSTLQAKFKIAKAELNYIRKTLKVQSKLDRTYQIELIDKDGAVCAVVEKIIHFKKKTYGILL
jgi:acyl-coenzyme A thioesterase PaaI-like protein